MDSSTDTRRGPNLISMDAWARRRLRSIAAQLDHLARRSMKPWLEAGLDPLGGAYGHLDRMFVPQFSSPEHRAGPSGETVGSQTLVQQARHLFSYSFLHERRGGDARFVESSHRLYAYLILGFSREPETWPRATPDATSASVHERVDVARALRLDRPLLHWVPRGGGALIEMGSSGDDFEQMSSESPLAVQLYAQAFAVLSLCSYARAFDVPEAANQALALFQMLDAKRHDLGAGGYDQRRDGGWLPFVGAPLGAAKCANTHIHLLEALIELSKCFPQVPIVTARLLELTVVISTKFCPPSGYLRRYVGARFEQVGRPEVSYGHDLEASWLLLDAIDELDARGALAIEQRRTVLAGCRRMAEHAVATGVDPLGGVFDWGVPKDAPSGPCVIGQDKVWWTQAEALFGIFRLFEATGEHWLIEVLENTLRFLLQRSWDPVGQEFFWAVDGAGRPTSRGAHKGEIWKTPYHTQRAFARTADGIRDLLRRDVPEGRASPPDACEDDRAFQ